MNPIYFIESLDEGVIEKIYVEENAYVYEWEKLFEIKTTNGNLIDISIGASGLIKDIYVKTGDPVLRFSILAELQDDDKISGSD